MANCEQYRQLLSHQLDETLPSKQAAALQEHLGRCDRCREFETTLVRQRTILVGLPRLSANNVSLPVDTNTTRPNLAVRCWRARIAVPVPLVVVLFAVAIGWGVLSSISSNQYVTKSVPGERQVRVIRLDPMMAIPVGQ
jgi:anti-sigma factor RsiW